MRLDSQNMELHNVDVTNLEVPEIVGSVMYVATAAIHECNSQARRIS
jgi:hypothetical protein